MTSGGCLKRLRKELQRASTDHNDLLAAITAYNGSGKRVEIYAQNVTTYSRFAQGGDISGRVMPV
jgi:hypothetical protein